MPLRPLSDTSAADWFVDSEADGWTKICLGPPGYAAYARVYFNVDDTDAQLSDDYNDTLGPVLRSILRTHTSTPDDCYFALWDGWGGFEGGPQDTGARWVAMVGSSPAEIAEARRLTAEAKLVDYAPAFDPAFLWGPKVTVPDRAFYLFGGPLAAEVDWGAADYSADLQRHYDDEPALMWPADHAWFVAGDVDPDWIGVGGTQALIDELVADARLDVAPTTYDATDWEDR
jgi:hypothetical protein